MARIAVHRIGGCYTIELRGELGASDLKRLERACGDALEHRLVPLELHLEHVSKVDKTARAYLDRLRLRGARITGTV